MNVPITLHFNPILDGEIAYDRLRAAMAAERQVVVLSNFQGKREYIETGQHAPSMVELMQTGELKLIRSSCLDGPFYLGIFDQQGRLRILVCRSPTIPFAPAHYELKIKGKIVVSEYLESARIWPGTRAVICVCRTSWEDTERQRRLGLA